MMEEKHPLNHGSMIGWRETITFITAFIGIIIAQITVTGSGFLIVRKLWLDEVLTATLVCDPSFSHALHALAGGADCQPPMAMVLQRFFMSFAPGKEPGTPTVAVMLRLFSLLATISAVVGLYILFRRVAPVLPSAAGALTLWCSPVVVEQAFEARCYALWLAAAVAFVLCLENLAQNSRNTFRHLALALSGVILCTTHYFGVVTLVLALTGYIFACRDQPNALSAVLPGTAFSLLAFMVCLPFPLGQKAAIGMVTWIPSITVDQFLEFLRAQVPVYYWMSILLYFLWLRRWDSHAHPTHSPLDEPTTRQTTASTMRALGGVAAWLGLPVALLVVSLLVAPSLMPRYTIVAAAGGAVIPVLLFQRFPNKESFVVCGLALFFSTFELYHLALAKKAQEVEVTDLINLIRSENPTEPVVFEHCYNLYPVAYHAPDLRDHCYLYIFPKHRPGGVNVSYAFMNAFCRQYALHYKQMALIDTDALQKLPRFWLVMAATADPTRIAIDYPGFRLTQIKGSFYRLDRET